jgi:hypothetical protein
MFDIANISLDRVGDAIVIMERVVEKYPTLVHCVSAFDNLHVLWRYLASNRITRETEQQCQATVRELVLALSTMLGDRNHDPRAAAAIIRILSGVFFVAVEWEAGNPFLVPASQPPAST